MNNFSQTLFDRMPLVGIMRNVPAEHIDTIALIYYRAGLINLEVTMNSAGAAEAIRRLVTAYGDRLNIGAGTICSMTDLEKALEAGAGFIVTPIINEEVIKMCVAQNIPIFPGAYTPTEIYKAWSMGAAVIKLFPAGDMTPQKMKEILAPLDFVSLMPTGGVNIDNFIEYFKAGAKAVGLGGGFFPKEVIEKQDWEKLNHIYEGFVKTYDEYISQKKI